MTHPPKKINKGKKWVSNWNINKEILHILESIENENTTFQGLWDSAKAVLRGQLIAMTAYIWKEKAKISNK